MESYRVPVSIENWLDSELNKMGTGLNQAKPLAQAIKKMADFYVENPQGTTPWSEPWCRQAQLAYYFPLNYLRSRRVFNELNRHNFFSRPFHWHEFGSGLCPSLNAFFDGSPSTRNLLSAQLIEQSDIPFKIAKENFSHQWKLPLENQKHFQSPERPKDFLLLSYSLTEIEKLPSWFWDFDRIVIIEPSTQEDGRHLMALRKEALERQFEVLAPCTHQEACPLLEKSKRDWCHDRLQFDRPKWFLDIEAHLPFKNATLTLSYLVLQKRTVSKEKRTEIGAIRVVGDPLLEKGKTRQLICRNSDREFLSFLTKNYPQPPLFDRGDLLEITGNDPGEKKGEEWRIGPDGIKRLVLEGRS